jgi:hypothetical protein
MLSSAKIEDKATKLLSGGSFGDPELRKSGTVALAHPVNVPGNGLHSWITPIIVGDQFVAFFQFLPDGTLMRFSAFNNKPGEYESCPKYKDWFDSKRISKIAGTLKKDGEEIGEPYLSFDKSPDRIVWGIPLIHKSGASRIVFLINNLPYESSDEGTFD